MTHLWILISDSISFSLSRDIAIRVFITRVVNIYLSCVFVSQTWDSTHWLSQRGISTIQIEWFSQTNFLISLSFKSRVPIISKFIDYPLDILFSIVYIILTSRRMKTSLVVILLWYRLSCPQYYIVPHTIYAPTGAISKYRDLSFNFSTLSSLNSVAVLRLLSVHTYVNIKASRLRIEELDSMTNLS